MTGWVRGMVPEDCCGTDCRRSPQNPSPPAGWLALVSRGNCTFVQKIQMAQAQGASGVIVHNNNGQHELVIMGGVVAPSETPITIPSVFVSQATGAKFREYLAASNSTAPVAGETLKVELSSCSYTGEEKKKGPLSRDLVAEIALLLTITVAVCTSIAILRYCEAHCEELRGRQAEDAPPPAEIRLVRDLPQRICELDEEEECCICLETFEAGNTLKRLPCGHEFHMDCIDQWLTTEHATCPM